VSKTGRKFVTTDRLSIENPCIRTKIRDQSEMIRTFFAMHREKIVVHQKKTVMHRESSSETKKKP